MGVVKGGPQLVEKNPQLLGVFLHLEEEVGLSEAKKKKGFGSREAEGVFLEFLALFMEFHF